MVRVDLRTIVMDVPPQDVISRDNVSVKVNAVLYFRVIDPEKAIIQVENRVEATSQLAQTTLRSVLGQHELDDMLAEREKLKATSRTSSTKRPRVGHQGHQRRDQARRPRREHDPRDCGAGGGRAFAPREGDSAEGEFQASQKLSEAAAVLAVNPGAMQLRYLQTLTEISGEKNSHTIVFPVPLDLLKTVMDQVRGR